MKLIFESVGDMVADRVYKRSLNDDYWKEISDKFPEYNFSDSNDNKEAIDYIYHKIKEKYPDEDWNSISNYIRDKISGGIT